MSFKGTGDPTVPHPTVITGIMYSFSLGGRGEVDMQDSLKDFDLEMWLPMQVTYSLNQTWGRVKE